MDIEKLIEKLETGRTIAVIGAGTMGAGIAAHAANCGFDVLLFDQTRAHAEAGLEKAKSINPPHFTTATSLARIKIAGMVEDLHLLLSADWICEAIVEKLELKRQLLSQIEPFVSPGTVISTNTSGLEIGLLAEGRSEGFRKRFLGTHFFNPPRYLKLLELIPTEETDPQVVQAITTFLEDRLGKRVVVAKDTPGFIANRYGMWSMYHAVHVAEKLRLTPEEVDAITGPFLGRPKSGSFRLNDIVGFDVMQDIAKNLLERCQHDPAIQTLQTPASLAWLTEKGWIGEKAGQGYYRRNGRDILTFDSGTQAYRQRIEPELPTLKELAKLPLKDRLLGSIHRHDPVGEFMRLYLHPVLSYAISIRAEIAHQIEDFDRVMEWGFGWEAGPFKMIDMLGPESFGLSEPFYRGNEQQAVDGTSYVPTQVDPKYATVTDFPVVDRHNTFTVRDMGEGVGLICTTTKMGVITPELVDELAAYLEPRPTERFVLTSEARAFSVGYNLQFFSDRIAAEDWTGINDGLARFQALNALLERRYVVAAVYGYCIGGGLEVAMSCPMVVAHPETKIGLPEAKVGLIPGGRGTGVMRLRAQATTQGIVSTVMALTLGTVSNNADESRAHGYLRDSDITAYSGDALLATAKHEALAVKLIPQEPWKQIVGPATGMLDRAQVESKQKGEMTEYDEVIGDHLKAIFTKTNSYEEALVTERARFVDLCQHGLTVARIHHMLETGKPLRN